MFGPEAEGRSDKVVTLTRDASFAGATKQNKYFCCVQSIAILCGIARVDDFLRKE